MLFKTKFFMILFVLYCPSSLLTPLPQPDEVATSNTNSLAVLGTNEVEQITPYNSIVTELIQQIDVKDDENRVISNINHVVIGDESNDTIPSITENNNNNETLNNGMNNVLANNVPIGNGSSSLNNTRVTSSWINSLNGNTDKTLKAANTTTPELDNASVTQTNALKTTNNSNGNNAPNSLIKGVSTVQNGGTPNVNVTSYLVPNTGGTTRSIDEHITSPIILQNVGTGVPILETIDEGNSLHESLYDTKADIAWRSDIPVKGNKEGVIKDTAQLESQNTLLKNNKSNGLTHLNKILPVDNSLKVLDTSDEDLKSKNDEEKGIFVIVNSGNIDGVSINSLDNSSNTIKNVNSRNSKLINDLVNSTINNVLSRILQQNHTNLENKNIFLLLNSGSISNIQISLPILENTANKTTLKDRSRRHLNDTSNSTVEPVTLKPSNETTNPIIDIKFRTGENEHRENNESEDNHQNNSILESNSSDNDTAVVNPVDDEDISKAEAPAFRSLILNKSRKPQHVSTNQPNYTKDNNLLLKLTPESLPIPFDLNQIPINNLLGGAFSFIKRLKRSSNADPWKTNCKSKHVNEHKKPCTKYELFNNDLETIVIPTRKSLDGLTNALKTYDSVELVCPLSVIVKLYAHQVLDNLANSNSDSVLNKILSSFVKGNEDAINLASKELSQLPIPVKLRLQLVHGNTKEFMEQLSAIVDAALCSLS